MKKVFLALGCLFVMTVTSYSQTTTAPTTTTTDYYGLGVSYNNGATPSIAGTGMWAHSLNTVGTFAFTVVDILPNTIKPLTVTSNIGTGIAQKLFTTGKVSYFMSTTAGISISGSNTGWDYTAGGMAIIPVSTKFSIAPDVRVLKSSVSNGTGYQLIPGVMVVW